MTWTSNRSLVYYHSIATWIVTNVNYHYNIISYVSFNNIDSTFILQELTKWHLIQHILFYIVCVHNLIQLWDTKLISLIIICVCGGGGKDVLSGHDFDLIWWINYGNFCECDVAKRVLRSIKRSPFHFKKKKKLIPKPSKSIYIYLLEYF